MKSHSLTAHLQIQVVWMPNARIDLKLSNKCAEWISVVNYLYVM
ncbi:hypothetical protein VCHC60A1_3094 [Vibrio cholerae HC-60A1]|nr:hypothetical protein VCHC60A1_3094 [Vibrio cholerae HC-60A1]